MIPKHHTLRFTDALAARRHNLRAHHAPHQVHLTYNSRAALFQLLSSLPQDAGSTVLLPAFHCVTLVDPVVRAGYQTDFYRIRADLTIDVEDLASRLKPGVAATVVVHFFGFPADLDAIVELARVSDSYLIEDCAHSFLSRFGDESIGRRGDFAIFSYYKFAPSLVGGSLVVNRDDLLLDLPKVSLGLAKKMVIVKRLLTQALVNASDNPLSSVLLRLDDLRIKQRERIRNKRRSDAARDQDLGPSASTLPSTFLNDPFRFDEDLARTAIPWFSQRIVESSRWEEMADKRRKNYLLLSRLVPDTDVLWRLLPELPEEIVPLAFPVILKNRTDHQQALRSLGVPFLIFGGELHSTLFASTENSRAEAEALSREQMLLPVHHLLNEHHIEAYVSTLLDYVDSL